MADEVSNGAVLGVQPDLLGGRETTVRSEAPTERHSEFPPSYKIEQAWAAKHAGKAETFTVGERASARESINPSTQPSITQSSNQTETAARRLTA